MRNLSIIILLAFIVIACNDEPVETVYAIPVTDKGVFIACEGNFLYGNGSLSFYNPEKKQVVNNIFYARNNAPLGDVVQSLALHQNQLYIVVNNSGKIVVTGASNVEFKGVITGLTSPRYIHFINNEKAYISDLYANHLTIFNPQNLEVTGSILIDGHTAEQMVQVGRYLFVSHWSYGETLLVIDTATDSLIDKIKVPLQPRDLDVDKNGKVWVLSDGGLEGSVTGKELPTISRVDPETLTIEQIYRFGESALPSSLKINSSGDTIYYLNRDVFKMAINSRQLPETPFLKSKGNLFYSLAVDPLQGEIYVSDAIDYTQNALIYRFAETGTLIDSFKVGINPSSFLFR
jgi:DNA-binding beta-propeller fold protein YncE